MTARLPLPFLLAGLLLGIAFPAVADRGVDALLARDTPPAGVLFEIVTGDTYALDTLLPVATEQATRLHDRFPGLEIVVLTHGSEQFALLEEERAAQPSAHGQVQSLVASGIPVEVCGNHASWRGKWADDFPDYVVVADSATTQIARYRERGFEVVRLRH
jgi:intracellular sulfur oxidation DsrE/DsrF family protein